MSAALVVKSVIDATNKKAPFKNISNNNLNKLDEAFHVTPLMGIFNTIVMIVALYMSFKCNNGFHFGSILMACCCSIFYIPYRLAVPC